MQRDACAVGAEGNFAGVNEREKQTAMLRSRLHTFHFLLQMCIAFAVRTAKCHFKVEREPFSAIRESIGFANPWKSAIVVGVKIHLASEKIQPVKRELIKKIQIQSSAKVGASGCVNVTTACLSLLPQLACSIHSHKTWCIDFSRSLYLQGSAKRRGLGCVNSVPGSAWL